MQRSQEAAGESVREVGEAKVSNSGWVSQHPGSPSLMGFCCRQWRIRASAVHSALCCPLLSKASVARLRASQDGPCHGSDAARRSGRGAGRWGHNWSRGTKTEPWDSAVG